MGRRSFFAAAAQMPEITWNIRCRGLHPRSSRGTASQVKPFFVALFVALAGCSGAAGASVESSLPADAIRLEDADVTAEIMAALNAGGSECTLSQEEKGLVICDQNRAGRATIIFVYARPLGLFIAHFLRKDGVECDAVVGRLNELNTKADPVKIVCAENRVTFAAPFLVPSYGLSPKDVQDHATRFREAVAALIRLGGLLEVLK
jgi:hypothetical protein